MRGLSRILCRRSEIDTNGSRWFKTRKSIKDNISLPAVYEHKRDSTDIGRVRHTIKKCALSLFCYNIKRGGGRNENEDGTVIECCSDKNSNGIDDQSFDQYLGDITTETQGEKRESTCSTPAFMNLRSGTYIEETGRTLRGYKIYKINTFDSMEQDTKAESSIGSPRDITYQQN